MAKREIFDFRSAYGQLILLVFLPISVLASVGALLVIQETSNAAFSRQEALATAALIRYEPAIKEIMPQLVQQQFGDSINSYKKYTNMADHGAPVDLATNLKSSQAQINEILSLMNTDQHLHRLAVIDESGAILMAVGFDKDKAWFDQLPKQDFVTGVVTPVGTAYGHLLGKYANNKYWLFVDMDNEPRHISQLNVLLALGLVGLTTVLLLLLILNIYAKRWIVPIYNMRLHLQQTTSENLYKPIDTQSSGELNLLQQDLIKTLRRLHSDFQDLTNHAEQTENDLKLAFDEMEMQNITNRRARDIAVSTSQEKSAFLANISHELRTPLNSIDGFINLMVRHGKLSAEQELYVQTIRKSSAHLLALVNDVLDFSKIEAGKLVLDRHKFNLYAAIYDVMDMLSPLASEKGLHMVVLYYNDVPTQIIGDALRVKQVLTNLVSNAIKFTDMGDIVVRVSLDDPKDRPAPILAHDLNQSASNMKIARNKFMSVKQPLSPTNATQLRPNHAYNDPIVDDRLSMDNILIAIQDSGRGIAKFEQTQLFKSFSQGDPSITRQYGGTGLGLVISKQLTRLMGGRIGFYDNAEGVINQEAATASVPSQSNSANRGSTFWFAIPAHVDVIEAMENEEYSIMLPVLSPFAKAHEETTPYQMLAWLTHNVSLQVLSTSLRPLNIELTQAKSLIGALDALKEKGSHWDWVIIDGSNDAQEDMAALLKQIRLHYQGKLAIFGYQVILDIDLLSKYKAFSLYQPLDKRQLYEMLDTQNALEKKSQPMPQWQDITVLVVDDHKPNLLVLDALLDELGIKVITASSGFDAIDIVSRHLSNHQKDDKLDLSITSHIDLIFMDIQMPRMSGHEAARQIRHIEAQKNKDSNSRIPIIALTAHGLSDEGDRLIENGIDDYVGKPISQPQLLQLLQRWLSDNEDITVNSSSKNKQVSAHSNIFTMGSSDSAITNAEMHGQHGLIIEEEYQQEDGELDNNKKPATLPVINWQDALTRAANKPELAAQLFKMLQDGLGDDMTELSVAWQTQDRSQLAQIAHRILGASRYTGLPQIRKASQDLEDKCMLNVQHTTPAQFAMLQPYFDALMMALQNLQDVDLADYPQLQKALNDHIVSENDMTWKMI